MLEVKKSKVLSVISELYGCEPTAFKEQYAKVRQLVPMDLRKKCLLSQYF